MTSKTSDLIYDFVYLLCEIEAARTPQQARDVLKDYHNEKKYKNIIDHGGFEAISWVGKQIIAMKEQSNAGHENRSAG